MRLGLGKQEQENFYMAAENVTRKRMETEVQGDEDLDRTQRREVGVGKPTFAKRCKIHSVFGKISALTTVSRGSMVMWNEHSIRALLWEVHIG